MTYRKNYTLGTVIFDAFAIIAQGATEEPQAISRLVAHLRGASDMLRRSNGGAHVLANHIEECAKQIETFAGQGIL